MGIPLPKVMPRKNNQIETLMKWGGFNNLPVVQEGQLTDCSNVSSDNFPCLSPRGARTDTNTLTSATWLSDSNGVLCWVDGTSFYYNGASKGTVTAGAKSIVEYIWYNQPQDRYETIIFIFPDKKYYNITTNTFGTVGTGTYPTAGSCPDMNYVCIHANRIFGVKGNVIYACQYNDPFDWTTFDTTNSAAWSSDTSESSSFTGITSYQGHVTMFKADLMYELYGDNSNNFWVKEVAKKGCIDGNTISQINGIVYFVSRDGVNIYGGGLPIPISTELGATYTSGVAGTDGRKYYLSLYNGSTYMLYVYDSFYKTWHKEDDLNVNAFALSSGNLYCLSGNKVKRFNYGSETVTWSATTEKFVKDVQSQKLLKELSVRVDLLDAASTVSIYIKRNNADWVLIKQLTTDYMNVYTLKVQRKKCDFFQLKFDGSGRAKIYELNKVVIQTKRGG